MAACTTESKREESIEELCLALDARASFYDMLGALFIRPLTQQQIDHLAACDLEGFAGLNQQFDRGVHDIQRYLRRRNTGTREALAVDYTSTFVGTKTADGNNAVPYESVFTSDLGLLCQESFHEVRAQYQAAGFAKALDDATPDDHLGYMCAFVGELTRRASASVRSGDIESAETDVRTSAAFARTHIFSWFENLEERALQIIETRFYRGVMEMAHGYFAFDDETVNDLVGALAELRSAHHGE